MDECKNCEGLRKQNAVLRERLMARIKNLEENGNWVEGWNARDWRKFALTEGARADLVREKLDEIEEGREPRVACPYAGQFESDPILSGKSIGEWRALALRIEGELSEAQKHIEALSASSERNN